MKKILLMSDTHGYMDQQILKYAKECDEVWHAGDIGDLSVTDTIQKYKPLRAVFGNIDGAEIRTCFPENNRFTIEGLDVWITHIGGYPGHYDKRVREALKINTPNLFICGHSHILKVINDKKLKLLHFNPGAIGKYGFHKIRTMLRFTVQKGKIDNLEVIEIER